LTPDDPSKLSLNYLEQDTTNANGDVNTDITITVSKPGPPTTQVKEVIRRLKLTSKGYSSDIYFQNIDNELNKLIKRFRRSSPTKSNVVFDIYADDESREQTKVYGDIYTFADNASCKRNNITCSTITCSATGTGCATAQNACESAYEIQTISTQTGNFPFNCQWSSFFGIVPNCQAGGSTCVQ
jgi:hypothetical protein